MLSEKYCRVMNTTCDDLCCCSSMSRVMMVLYVNVYLVVEAVF